MRLRIPVGLLVAATFVSAAGSEILPEQNLEWEVLHARLIVEARLVEGAVVEVTRVHHGEAMPGDRLALLRFADLPRVAYENRAALNRGTGIPIVDQEAVLFLRPSPKGGWEPESLGSGVKWILGDRVYGYGQPDVGGAYALLPDPEARTRSLLRGRISVELERRQKFEAILSRLDPGERARALLSYVLPEPRGAYGLRAHEAFRGTGPEAALVLHGEARRDRPAEERLTLAELLVLSGNGGGQFPAASVESEVRPAVEKLPFPLPSWSNLSPDQRTTIVLWRRALGLIAEDSSPASHQNDTMRAALAWALRNRDAHVMQSVLRAFSRAPEPENVPALAEALRAWTPAATALDGYAPRVREEAVRTLGDQRLPQAVPVLAGLLEDPQAEVREEARRSLSRIVGKDLGAKPAPWLAWLAGLAGRK